MSYGSKAGWWQWLCAVSFVCWQCAAAVDWVQSNAGTNYWEGVACSADGTRCAAAARFGPQNFGPSGVYFSTNSGATWTQANAPVQYWGRVACSSNGLLMAAIGNQSSSTTQNGGIYLSSDGGVNWSLSTAPTNNWSELACSADGTKLVANIWYGSIYVSTNSGDNWIPSDAPALGWGGITTSADGLRCVTSGGESNPNIHDIYVSTNYGLNWTQAVAPADIRELACSADGNRLVAVGTQVYVSADGAQSWTAVGTVSNLAWLAVTASADGRNLTVAGIVDDTNGYAPGPIFASADFGTTWHQKGTVTGWWEGLAASADGSKLVAIQGGISAGPVYRWQDVPTLAIAPSGGGFLISWPASATGFALQEISNCVATNWTVTTNAVALVNNLNQVLVNRNAGSRFYRLVSH